MKVLHGTMEVANQMHTLARGLKNRGIEAETLNYYPSYLGYEADMVFDVQRAGTIENIRFRTAEIAVPALAYYDVFHFHFSTTLTLDHDELPLLSNARKPVFMHHWGSDVRMISVAKRLNPFAVAKSAEAPLRQRLELLGKYISRCIVADHELEQYVQSYYDEVHVIPTAIDLDRYTPVSDHQPRSRPLVVHAPTSPQIKGTYHVQAAVESLQDEVDFDFLLIQNTSHEEAMALYRQADIVVDQLLLGSHGLLAAECMALGKPVICWISDFMRDKYPPDLPIVSANPRTLKHELKALLLDCDRRTDLGIQGRRYATERHDMHKVAANMHALYDASLPQEIPERTLSPNAAPVHTA